ncbi:multicopper oxidase domain-containing protein [Acinetobacter faecalis]|uniref:multicopper oxidase domain-containing protein n=1 Tax=Acinetobacter faecalis TaxID=2665161 RepID=UPI002A919C46|nr:multicopper oxidase domain-containing protein [Acinetobacter faecalis]MDY6480863.1 multicopper oxidase domain-containing protein [Acinetobacter faecalis]
MSLKLHQHLVIVVGLLASSFAFSAVKEYHLNIDEQTVNITGKAVKRITVNGQFPAPNLEFKEGDDAVIHVHNHLKKQDTSVHWHGLLLPGLMDGVPGFNQFKAIKPNKNFTYKFKVRQNGTYWYHAHSKGQEQDGLYGALVIYPKNKKLLVAHEKADRDYVIMLSDFHESSSAQIMANLKKSSEFYQNKRETLKDVFAQIKKSGLKNTWNDRAMWNQMRMLKTDMSDVTGYTFLVNGKMPEQNWTGMFKPNEKVRLRIINASAMSFFDVRIPNLKMTVVSADGQAVQPVNVDEFRIGAAETYDVIVQPKQDHYQFQAESIDRTGFALASLQNEQVPSSHSVQIPQSRPRALLTMEDMGHGSMQEMSHDTSDMKMSMQDDQMDHSKMKHEQLEDQHEQENENIKTVQGWANASTPVGNKALQYADLKSLKPQLDTREATRELEIHLGGTMERYIWTINGKKFNEAEPLNVKYGERIRLKFVNDSMMAHPMHLHGMFMQLENGQALSDLPNKHTIVVPPGKTMTALLTANELGEWAIHCHLLYHMSAGMMSKLIVANVDEDAKNKGLEPKTIKSSTSLHQSTTTEGGQHEHH